jgi:2-oxoglutarate ferredoxin oxidoreductase subunit gamma
MQEDIIISGFGGQGALFAGQLLAYTALDQGKEVTWIPSYGPEMRGGTAHCVVVIADEPIGSPVVRHPSTAIVMNLPSLVKYGQLLQPGGLLVVNSSLIPDKASRADIREIRVPASDIASELGDVRMSNVVLLGAFLRWSSLLTLKAVEASMDAHVGGRARRLLEQNKQALHRGYEVAGHVTEFRLV